MADTPWRDDPQLPEPLREVIDSAREDEPSPEDVAALALKVAPLLVVAPAAGAAAAAATSGAAKAAAALKVKLVVGALMVVSVPAAVVGYRYGAAPRPKVEAARPVAAVVPPQEVPEPALEVAPPAAPAEEPEAKVPPIKRPRPAAEDSLAREAALLELARGALAENPKAALAMAENHQQRFPRGALAQEREVVAIDALSRLGQHRAARRRGLQFLESYPSSAHAPQVKTILERVGR